MAIGTTNIGFEEKLWTAADKLRSNMDTAAEEDIHLIASAYQNWCQEKEYEDVKGFCKEATLTEVLEQDYILTPGRYVGIAKQEDDGEPFDEKMTRLTTELYGLFEEAHKLEVIGYGKKSD